MIEFFNQIPKTIREIDTPIKLIALVVVLIFLAVMFLPRDKECQISIVSPGENDKGTSSLTIYGTSKYCRVEDTNYTIAILDPWQFYYYQFPKISFSSSRAWKQVINFPPQWSGEDLTLKAISYPEGVAIVNNLKALPNGSKVFDHVTINVM